MRRALCLAILAALSVAGSHASAVVIQVLVAQGDPVPGAPGETFEFARNPGVGVDGTTFTAFDTSLPGSERLWVADVAGNLTPITHVGASAPGAGGASFLQLVATPLVGGSVGVLGWLTGAGVGEHNDNGYWLWDAADGLRLLVREGDPVPGTNGAVVSDPMLRWNGTSAAELAFSATLVGGDADASNDAVLLRSDPSSGTRVLLREGDPAPGIPGRVLGNFEVGDHRGRLLIGTRPGFAPFEAIYLESAAGDLEVIYEAGDDAPGVPGGTFSFLSFALPPPGQVPAFGGAVTTPTGSQDGIWYLDANDELALAAREFQALAGGFVLRTLNSPVVDGAGRVFFEGNAVDAQFDVFSSLFSYDPAIESLESVARVETPIPCMADAMFTGFFRNPFANARGQIAFWGAIEGTGIPRDSAIYARLADKTFVVIAREQQSFEVTPGVFKTVQHVNLSDSGNDNALSDDGRVTFTLEFTDRSSALLVVRLDEPGDPGLLRARNSRASERARCAHVAPAMRSR